MTPASSSTTRLGGAFALASAFLAAAFFIPYKAATGIASINAIVIAMLAPAALLNTFTSIAYARNGNAAALRIDRTTLVAAGGLGLLTVIGNVCITEALSRLDAGMTSLLTQTQLLFVAVAAWFFLREAITLRFVIGAAIALAGVAVIRWPTNDAATVDGIGILWALGAALAFGLMHVVTRHFIARIQPVLVNALRLWLAVAVLLLLPGRAAALIGLSSNAYLLAACAAFFGPFLARIMIMSSVRHLQASHAALFALLTPVFAFPMELAILGSTPGYLELVGGVIILGGIAIPALEMARRSTTAPP